MKHLLRCSKTGRFVARPTTPNIVNGRLYDYKGTVVRAKALCPNGLRMVSYHKTLNGFVKDSDLKVIGKDKVKSYLDSI